MKTAAIAIALLVSASLAHAETVYSADFVEELRSLGRGQDAFLYALVWAGNGDQKAEVEVVYSLLNGKDVAADPMAAMAFACGPRRMDPFYVQKALIVGNLMLTGTGVEIVRCDDMRQDKP